MDTRHIHRTLKRQVSMSLKTNQAGQITGLKDLLHTISQTYDDMDDSRRRLERSIAMTSEELNTLYLEAQKEKLAADQANESKSQFLATMSHEIRTPLNGVLGFANLLRATDLTADQHETLKVIIHSGKTLLSLLNGILDLSKVEAGNIVLENIPFNLHDTIETCVALFRGQTTLKTIDINVYIDPHLGQVYIGDPERLSQVVTNLISNAIKFTETGGIGIEVVPTSQPPETSDYQSIEIRVSDTGTGIAQDKLNDIFDKFVQADASTTRKFGGTGLGLSISKHLVNLMGGHIRVESELDKGSTFTISLDMKTSKDGSQSLLSTLDISKVKGHHALIVDDTQINRRYFKAQVEDFGMSCDTVNSVDACLEYLAKNKRKIDVLITDYLMPERDGIDLIHSIRANPEYENLPIILSSSAGIMNQEFNNVGYNALVAKPIGQRKFFTQLERVLHQNNLNTLQTSPNARDVNTPDLSGSRILIAEDNHINQKLLQKTLVALGAFVDVVGNGSEAVLAMQTLDYDLVLMDIRMPVMDGEEAIAHIRALPTAASKTPIIVLTANALVGSDYYINKGADDYMSKPIDLPVLEDKARHWIDIAKEEEASTAIDLIKSKEATPNKIAS